MCLGSDELLPGPLIDFHTRSIRANVLHARALVVGQELKQIWRDGTSRARLLDLWVALQILLRDRIRLKETVIMQRCQRGSR